VSTSAVRPPFADHPLVGKRIVLTRPVARAGDFESRIRALGGDPVLAPAIAIEPPETWTVADAALRRVETFDWIAFTSANAVHAIVQRADAIGVSRATLRDRRLAAVGPATAAAVRAALRDPDVVPTTHTAEALAHEFPDAENARVLFARGELASDALPTRLRERGAFVDEVTVYRTVPGGGVAAIVAGIRAGTIDALLFASASAVRFVAEAVAAQHPDTLTSGPAGRAVIVCIGPVTADAARAAGFDPVVVAESAEHDELIECVTRRFAAGDDTANGNRT
jgi:uroporphyrinogen-III synthase